MTETVEIAVDLAVAGARPGTQAATVPFVRLPSLPGRPGPVWVSDALVCVRYARDEGRVFRRAIVLDETRMTRTRTSGAALRVGPGDLATRGGEPPLILGWRRRLRIFSDEASARAAASPGDRLVYAQDPGLHDPDHVSRAAERPSVAAREPGANDPARAGLFGDLRYYSRDEADGIDHIAVEVASAVCEPEARLVRLGLGNADPADPEGLEVDLAPDGAHALGAGLIEAAMSATSGMPVRARRTARVVGPVRFYWPDGRVSRYDGLDEAAADFASAREGLVTLSFGTGNPGESYGFETELEPDEAHRLGAALIEAGLRGR